MKKIILAGCAAAFVLAGCASVDESQKNDATPTSASPDTSAQTGKASGKTSTGVAGGYVWSERMGELKRQMETATHGTGVAVTQTSNNELQINIPSDTSFAVGRAMIKRNFSPVLNQLAQGLRTNSNAEVRIIGHTDSTGTDAINDRLSLQRAAATLNYLMGHGASSTVLKIEGRGSREPIVDNSTPAGRAQNRRVEIFVGERAVQGS
ncbi:MAG: OmpA family protein [Burkholderiaceae bacterium]|jgi:outer membrane protein OmpA-like peptidoglycan-associated protein|nr:OmpA family protein [Burkholderiaceae bacterium]